MLYSLIKTILYWLTRPLAKYMIYPGSITFLMAGALQDAKILKHELIEMGGKPVALVTEDKRHLDAMFFSAEILFPEEAKLYTSSSRPTVILCPGNGMLYPFAWSVIRFYLTHGANVMTFNYGGYGDSQGAPCTESTYQDGEAAYQYIMTKEGINKERIVIHGLSLGGGAASYLASKYPVHLLLDRTFTSVGAVSKSRILGALADFVYPYNNIAKIEATKGKIHVIDAVWDELMTPKHTDDFFAEIMRTRHPEVPEGDYPLYREKYVTEVPGKHNIAWLDDNPLYHPAQEHFLQCFFNFS